MDGVLEALSTGGVALLATDTVYGLAALPGTPGERRIYELKRRPADMPLARLVSGERMLRELSAGPPAYALCLVRALWPGALTVVVEACKGGTLALRCPDWRPCLELISRLGGPVACTSANLHGQPTPQRKAQLPGAFRALPGFAALPEACAGSASTIVECVAGEPRILREGPVSAQVVRDVARAAAGGAAREGAACAGGGCG